MADKLSDAKAVLAGANKLSSEADPTGAMKKTVAPNPMPKVKIASTPGAPSRFGVGDGGVRDMNQKVAAEEGAKVGMTSMPIMHDGGVVKKTEPVLMEKGEGVIPKAKMQNADLGAMAGAKKEAGAKAGAGAGKKAAVKHKHTHIEHHDNGSHTVRHTPRGGGEEVSYSAPDMAGVHAGLDANVGQPAAAPMAAAGGASPDMAGAGAAAAPAGGAAPAPAAPPAGAPPAGM